VTQEAGALLVFDEVVTGFRCHPGGIQALFGVSADLGSYGKVLGGGFPIGAIAGRREFMDALDGGAWQYGDDSIPSVGVTYFAGTFVRHPLALAAAKAVLEHLKREGPELQATLTRSTAAMVDELNAFCREVGAPIVLRSFSSVWKVFFEDQAPLQDLLFAMMRNRGVHILDNFPCFMTTAHSAQDIAVIKSAFKGAVAELQAAEFIASRPVAARSFDALRPPVPGARLGRDADGQPAWFVAHPQTPGKYIKVEIQ
jgi:glutamate-1-semialdehyde aminotransferase